MGDPGRGSARHAYQCRDCGKTTMRTAKVKWPVACLPCLRKSSGWTCPTCGSADPEHPSPCPTNVQVPPKWEPVTAHTGGKGTVVYWRLVAPDGQLLGAVRQQSNRQWSALRYGPNRRQPATGIRQLGEHRTWQKARRAVADDVTTNPTPQEKR